MNTYYISVVNGIPTIVALEADIRKDPFRQIIDYTNDFGEIRDFGGRSYDLGLTKEEREDPQTALKLAIREWFKKREN